MHDMIGQILILLVTFAIITISLLADHLGHKKWFTINPLLTLVVIGLIIRMDTEIHRMGRFLRFLGDPRELFKAADSARNYISIGDAFILLLILALTIYSEVQAWQYLKSLHLWCAVSYAVATVFLIVVAGHFALAAAQIGKAPLPPRETVEQALPK